MNKQISRKALTLGPGENSNNLCEAGISSCSTCFIDGDCARQKAGGIGALEGTQELSSQTFFDDGGGKFSVCETIGTTNNGDLYNREEIENLLHSSGSLDEVCSSYAERFGNQLVWVYPLSDDMRGGGAIVPVREGFLFIPYSDQQRGYDVSGVELLDVNAIKTMKAESKAYFDGLFSALSDMETVLRNGGLDFDR